jgi:prophage maintenance system killer protein
MIIETLDRINQMTDKLEAALEMFCFVARTQMFLDGNKRVAQLMCNKIMMENDIGIFSVPYEEIDHFKELLVEFCETDNSDKIKDFFRSKCLLLNPEYEIQREKTDL